MQSDTRHAATRTLATFLATALVLLVGTLAWPGDQGKVTIELSDGTSLTGRLVAEDAGSITLLTEQDVEMRVPRDAVASMHGTEGDTEAPAEPSAASGVPEAPSFRHTDPNHTRLLFAPTGRPLGRGEGQFTDYYVLFPGFSYGLTDNLSLMGGMSVIPGLGLGEQVYYIAPRLAFQTSRRTSFSVGGLYASTGDELEDAGAALVFAVGTYGEPQGSFSLGLGHGLIGNDGDLELAGGPIVMLGGERQLSESAAFVTETWVFTENDFDLMQQPIGMALRFFGDRLSADVGIILVGELLSEGFPVPWLSMSYSFGTRPQRDTKRSLLSSFHQRRPR